MQNRKIATKLWLILGIAWVLGAGTGAFLLYRVSSVTSAYNHLIANEIQQRQTAQRLQTALKGQVQEWKNVLIRGADTEKFRKHTQELKAHDESIQKMVAELLPKVGDPEAKALFSEFQSAHEKMDSAYAEGLRVFTAGAGNNMQEADKVVSGVDRAANTILDKAADRLAERVDLRVREQQERARASGGSSSGS